MGSTQTGEPFRARRLLRGGHRQTLANFFLPRRLNLPPAEERLIEVEPGIPVLCHCHWQDERTQALTLLIVHGLEGSSDSGYALGLAAKGLAAGMNVVRMNQRNCGGTNHLAPTLYHSGRSSDVAAVSGALIARDRIARLALAGFSMGGNLVLKLAGEWCREAPPQLKAVAAVCPAIDLAASADALHEKSNRVYEYYFLLKLGQRLRQKVRHFPGRYDAAPLKGLKSLREFDDKITAPYSGFAGAADYYDQAAASRVIGQIAVPTLILHAANDPFIRITPETRAKIASNSSISFRESRDGGHCAFLAAANGYDGRWAEREVIEYLREF